MKNKATTADLAAAIAAAGYADYFLTVVTDVTDLNRLRAALRGRLALTTGSQHYPSKGEQNGQTR